MNDRTPVPLTGGRARVTHMFYKGCLIGIILGCFVWAGIFAVLRFIINTI